MQRKVCGFDKNDMKRNRVDGGPSSRRHARATLLGVTLQERIKCLISCRHAALKLCFCF